MGDEVQQHLEACGLVTPVLESRLWDIWNICLLVYGDVDNFIKYIRVRKISLIWLDLPCWLYFITLLIIYSATYFGKRFVCLSVLYTTRCLLTSCCPVCHKGSQSSGGGLHPCLDTGHNFWNKVVDQNVPSCTDLATSWDIWYDFQRMRSGFWPTFRDCQTSFCIQIENWDTSKSASLGASKDTVTQSGMTLPSLVWWLQSQLIWMPLTILLPSLSWQVQAVVIWAYLKILFHDLKRQFPIARSRF